MSLCRSGFMSQLFCPLAVRNRMGGMAPTDRTNFNSSGRGQDFTSTSDREVALPASEPTDALCKSAKTMLHKDPSQETLNDQPVHAAFGKARQKRPGPCKGDDGAAFHGRARALPDLPTHHDGAGSHTRATKASSRSRHNDEPQAEAVARTRARIATDDDDAAAHALPLAGQRGAQIISDTTGNAQFAARHCGRRAGASRALDGEPATTHLQTRARADIALDHKLAARHARADIVDPVVRAGDQQTIVGASGDVDAEPVTQHAKPITLAQRLPLDRGRSEPRETLGRETEERKPHGRPGAKRQTDHVSSSRRRK